MGRITERIDRITLLEGEYRSPTPPVPRSVKIELTARCDFQCFFCASEMRALAVEEIGLFYLGESFLCRWLPEAVRFAKHECGYPYVFLTTNGRMATPQRVRECMEAGLDSLKFSFNFADAEQFGEVTNVRKSQFRALRAANLAEDVRGTVCESCIAYSDG